MKNETIPVRVESKLKKELLQLAKQDHRNLSDYIRVVLMRHVEAKKEQTNLFKVV